MKRSPVGATGPRPRTEFGRLHSGVAVTSDAAFLEKYFAQRINATEPIRRATDAIDRAAGRDARTMTAIASTTAHGMRPARREARQVGAIARQVGAIARQVARSSCQPHRSPCGLKRGHHRLERDD